jgi:hypothetical protein
VDPAAPVRIKRELIEFMEHYGYQNLQQMREAFLESGY